MADSDFRRAYALFGQSDELWEIMHPQSVGFTLEPKTSIRQIFSDPASSIQFNPVIDTPEFRANLNATFSDIPEVQQDLSLANAFSPVGNEQALRPAELLSEGTKEPIIPRLDSGPTGDLFHPGADGNA